MSDQTSRKARLLGSPERRAYNADAVELRSGDKAGEHVFNGHASVFDAPYAMYGGPDKGGWNEVVDSRAFDATLAADPNVSLLVEHTGLALARTTAGTLDLSTDKRGLKTVARLYDDDPDALRVIPKLRRRNVTEMSFAFRTLRDSWNADETERRLIEVTLHNGDVSIVNNGANPATDASIRKLTDAIALFRDIDPADAMAELRGLDDPADAIAEARRHLAELHRKITPASARRISVADAEAFIAAPR